LKKATKRSSAPKKRDKLRKGAKPRIEANPPKPFLPYHIAALAWILFPGGGVAGTTADVTGLDDQIQAYNPIAYEANLVKAQLNAVFGQLTNFRSVAGQAQLFDDVRKSLLTLMPQMNNLWAGKDSRVNAELIAKIASIV
jgi:hypothetical protein